MKRDSLIRLFFIPAFIFTLFAFGTPSIVSAAEMNDYCQVPPFVSNMVPPNVMLLVDVSGSMGCPAYRQASDRQRYCSLNTNIECDEHHTHDGVNPDCQRTLGLCVGTGHDKHCEFEDEHHHHQDCNRDTDCTRSWGSCSSTNTSLNYGTCSNNATTGCSVNADCGATNTCDPRQTYEGYFVPSKYYVLEADNVYRENIGYVSTGDPCVIKYTYPCNTSRDPSSRSCPNRTETKPDDALNTCSKWYCTPKGNPTTQTGDCGAGTTGNWLNFMNMSRIDLLRWAMTGGAPQTCTTSQSSPLYCDPRRYKDPNASTKIATVCSDTLKLGSDGTTGHGCILKSGGITDVGCSNVETPSGVSVAVPWTGRLDEGLAFQFEKLPVKPRMGAMFFADSGIKDTSSIFLGDFTGPNSSLTYSYENLITNVDTVARGVYTPTGPAMISTLNYFKEVVQDATYSGLDAKDQSQWKSPLYNCNSSGSGANCKYNPCVKNFVLLMSDGLWNRPSCLVTTNADSDPARTAYTMHFDFANSQETPNANIKISSVYTVGMFVNTLGERALQNTAMYGSFDTSGGRLWPGGTTGFPDGLCNTDDPGCSGTSRGSTCTAIPASSPDWDKDGDGVPDTYYSADDALNMRTSLQNAVMAMLAHVTSGTAASVLASGEGSGANLAQAIYYPRRGFYRKAADWVGGLQNFWYYVDPFFSSSNIREEGLNADETHDNILDLKADGTGDGKKDYILQFFYDPEKLQAAANRYYDTAGDGAKGTLIDSVDFESLGNLWEAGKKLWSRTASTRNIYALLDSTKPLTDDLNRFFTTFDPAADPAPAADTNLTALRPLLNTDASANGDATTQTAENNRLAAKVINWVRGDDQSSLNYTGSSGTLTEDYRPRTVDLSESSGSGVWKLGDIIDSTPRIVSWVPLNQYDKIYGDFTYTNFVTDYGRSDLALTSHERYRNRGAVFVGSNDGMLHAFKLGQFGLQWKSKTLTQKATLKYCSLDPSKACAISSDCGVGEGSCTSDTDLGEEMWAFIPKNVLPYLKYLKDTEYCHLYGVDLTSYVFDASIGIDTAATGQLSDCSSAGYSDYWKCKKSGKSWKTILIGGMRYGGACRDTGAACEDGTTDCVNNPKSGVGYSSYFALDITDPYTPKLMWEFSNPLLGYATSGPAVMRISSRSLVSASESKADGASATTNGRWFVVFGSGPTGPIETTEHQFMGKSGQNLRLFVLDVKSGSLLRTIDAGASPLNITNAFGGSLLNASHDSDIDYQDDALYMGYTKRTGSGTGADPYKWTDGGILRLLTRTSVLNGADISATGVTALNPNNWVVSKAIDGIGPVTSSVVRLQNKNTGKLWLYSGTGRYFFKLSTANDDADGQRHIFGFKDPCFTGGAFKAECTDTSTGNDLSAPVLTNSCWFGVDTTSAAGYTSDVNSDSYCGWRISLDAADTTYNSERVVTDPLATGSGAVFFTTNKPYLSSCTTGGKTALWAVKYDTGAAPGAVLKGKALIQVSTGSIEQLDLQKAFDQKGNRKTTDIEGVPPTAQGLSIITAPPPLKRVLHMKER